MMQPVCGAPFPAPEGATWLREVRCARPQGSHTSGVHRPNGAVFVVEWGDKEPGQIEDGGPN
jgi:hypothetical protein